MFILRYIVFSKIILHFSFTFFVAFFNSEKKALKVRVKCGRGQGKVCQGAKSSLLGVKEKCVRGQGEVHRGSRRSAFTEYVVFS